MEDMLMLATMESSADDPKTFKQAMKSPDSVKWVEACAAEVASLVENAVFAVVDWPTHPVITVNAILTSTLVTTLNSLKYTNSAQ